VSAQPAPVLELLPAAEQAAAAVPRRGRLQEFRRALLQVFGIPDFERYQAHMQAKHPGAPRRLTQPQRPWEAHAACGEQRGLARAVVGAAPVAAVLRDARR
jgi:uncharacterized short protein YbdD (DUF466 family)